MVCIDLDVAVAVVVENKLAFVDGPNWSALVVGARVGEMSAVVEHKPTVDVGP